MAWLADDLLTDIQREGMLPSSTATATTTADILAHADKEIASYFVPKVLKVYEEWFATKSYITTVAQQARYRLPSRAVSGRLRDVQLVRGGSWQILPRIEPSDARNWSAPGSYGVSNAFFMENNYVVLCPSPSGGGDTLRLRYYARPGRLCLSSASTTCGKITNITGTTTLAIAHNAGDINASAVDIIHADPPFDYVAVGLPVSGHSSGEVDVLASTWNYEDATQEKADAVLNCYVVAADQSPVVSLPESLWYAVATRTAARTLLALGYMQEGQSMQADAERLCDTALEALQPRTDSRPRKLSRWLSGPLGRKLAGYPWFSR